MNEQELNKMLSENQEELNVHLGAVADIFGVNEMRVFLPGVSQSKTIKWVRDQPSHDEKSD